MQRSTNIGFLNYSVQPPKPYVNFKDKMTKKLLSSKKSTQKDAAEILLNGSVIVLGPLPVVLPNKDNWNKSRATNLKAKLGFDFVAPSPNLEKDKSVVFGKNLEVVLGSSSEIKAGNPAFAIKVHGSSKSPVPKSTVTVSKPIAKSPPPAGKSPNPTRTTSKSPIPPAGKSPVSHHQHCNLIIATGPPNVLPGYFFRNVTKYHKAATKPPKQYVPLVEKHTRKRTVKSSSTGPEAQIKLDGALIALPPIPVTVPAKADWGQKRAQVLQSNPSFKFVEAPPPGAEQKERSVVFGVPLAVHLSTLADIKQGKPAFTVGAKS